MPITTQNSWNFDSIYNIACQYASAGYHNSINLVTTHSNQAYSKLPPLRPLVARYASISFNTTKGFLWRNKEIVIGGCSVIGVALLILHYRRKNSSRRPLVREVKKAVVQEKKKAEVEVKVEKKPEEKNDDRLVVKMQPVLQTKLSIEIPKQRHAPPPPNVSLTFCIDVSSSMNVVDRIGAVRKGLLNVLNDAQAVVNNRRGANISLALIGFNERSEVITPITQLTPYKGSGNDVLGNIIGQINTFQVGGTTDILKGLEQATQEVEQVAHTNRRGSHTLILLTDGEDNSINQCKLSTLQDKLASIPAKLFAIGIGKSHNKSVLQQIAVSQNGNLKGTYIDTTLGLDTIESAISKIYNQAIASFHDLELSASGLPADAWSVIGIHLARGQSKWNLGSLSEGQTLQKVVEIHLDRLTASLDLSKVVFTLTFADSNGVRGQHTLPWNPKIANHV